MIHLLLHVMVPAGAAYFLYRDNWLKAWAMMAAGIILDIDHLFAVPIYDPSNGFSQKMHVSLVASTLQ